MILCKDCAHYRPSTPPAPCFARCAHPDFTSTNPVDGSKVMAFCEERRKTGVCGRAGCQFVAAPAPRHAVSPAFRVPRDFGD